MVMSFSATRQTETLHQRIERERNAVAPKSTKHRGGTGWRSLETFRLYAAGRQVQTLNSDQIRILQGVLRHKFCDNILKKILTEHASRLRVARFDVDDDAVRAFLFETWIKNQFPKLFSKLTYGTLRDGNYAVGVDWIPGDGTYGGRVQFTLERWWNGTEGVFVMYDENGQAAYAVKEWQTLDFTPVKRRNIYYPDRIMRFRWNGGSWEPVTLPGETELEPILADGTRRRGTVPWEKPNGDPLGIPFVHFANGSDDDSLYGQSLLDGGPLAFQDQINAIQHDITAASMFNGSPQTYSKGFELPDDDEGNPTAFQGGPGVHHHSDMPTADFGIIEPGDLSQLKGAYLTKLEALCRNTHTPLHVITGQWPSGEAIFREDLPLVMSVKELGESVGPSASSLMHKATELHNAFGTGPELNESKLITCIFDDPALRDPLALWAIAEKAAPFVSKAEVLRIAGYAPDRITKIMDEMDEEKAASVSAAQAAFNSPASLDALQRATGASVSLPGKTGQQGTKPVA